MNESFPTNSQSNHKLHPVCGLLGPCHWPWIIENPSIHRVEKASQKCGAPESTYRSKREPFSVEEIALEVHHLVKHKPSHIWDVTFFPVGPDSSLNLATFALLFQLDLECSLEGWWWCILVPNSLDSGQIVRWKWSKMEIFFLIDIVRTNKYNYFSWNVSNTLAYLV